MREDMPTRAEVEAEEAMDDDRREGEYRTWCRERGLDPEDVGSMTAYEEDFDPREEGERG